MKAILALALFGACVALAAGEGAMECGKKIGNAAPEYCKKNDNSKYYYANTSDDD